MRPGGGLGSVYVEDSQETNPSPVDAATMREKEREREIGTWSYLICLLVHTAMPRYAVFGLRTGWYPEVLVSGNRDVCAQGV